MISRPYVAALALLLLVMASFVTGVAMGDRWFGADANLRAAVSYAALLETMPRIPKEETENFLKISRDHSLYSYMTERNEWIDRLDPRVDDELERQRRSILETIANSIVSQPYDRSRLKEESRREIEEVLRQVVAEYGTRPAHPSPRDR